MKIDIDPNQLEMKIDIDPDQFMGQTLLEAIELTYNDIVKLRRLDHIESYQMEDLDYNLQLLPALKTVYKYYTVHIDHYKLDEFDTLDINFDEEVDG